MPVECIYRGVNDEGHCCRGTIKQHIVPIHSPMPIYNQHDAPVVSILTDAFCLTNFRIFVPATPTPKNATTCDLIQCKSHL